jgi:cytochrome P450
MLDRNPSARGRLEAELAEVLGDRDGPPAPADVPALPYAQAVVNETLRLYPPAYVTGREAVRDTTFGGLRIPKRHIILISMYTTHRDPRFFPEPDEFRPERWLDGLEKRLPRGAFIPFGLGSRKCFGASFAMMEATVCSRRSPVTGGSSSPRATSGRTLDHAPPGGGDAEHDAVVGLTATSATIQQ